MLDQRVGGVKFSDFPCLALGRNLNLTSDNMADIWRQVIAVDDEKDPDTKSITDEVPHPEYGQIWIP